ncbi:MAG: DUF349 domain-containing protein, partial [Bacteroidales bacterium]|nr:DUF349 domain-containing protein [Bacteroidales bacterium]
MDISDTDKLQESAGLEPTPEKVDQSKQATTNDTQDLPAEEKTSPQEAATAQPVEVDDAAQEVKTPKAKTPKAKTKTEAEAGALVETELETKAEAKVEAEAASIEAEAETKVEAEVVAEAELEAKAEAKVEAETASIEAEAEAEVETKTETKVEAETKVETEIKVEAKTPKEEEAPKEEAPAKTETVPGAASLIDHFVIRNLIDQLRELIQKESIDVKSRIENIKQSFYKQHKLDIEASRNAFIKAGGDPADFVPSEVNAIEAEFKELMNQWREKRIKLTADLEKQKKDNLIKKNQLIEVIKALTDSSDDIRQKIPEFRKLQQEWKNIGQVPAEDVNELWKNYQFEVERFYDQIKITNEFRDYDFKKNLEIKTELCEIAERLKEDSDVVKAFKRLQKLHEEWRETGPVAKELREELWQRFKDASTEINKKYQAFFERLKEIENENLAQKTAICESLEAIDYSKLKSFRDWDRKTTEVIEWQERWKTIGFAPKKANAKVFERFRTACDLFFQTKSNYYKSVKESLSQNLELKRELCEKAESLKDSTDWNATSNQLIQIQKEWKTIGPVPRKHSDALWKRFISACDYFFEQKEKNTSSQRSVEYQNLAAKKELIAQVKALAESEESTDKENEETLRTIRELNAKWNAIGFVPFREKDKIYKQWRNAMDSLMSH